VEPTGGLPNVAVSQGSGQGTSPGEAPRPAASRGPGQDTSPGEVQRPAVSRGSRHDTSPGEALQGVDTPPKDPDQDSAVEAEQAPADHPFVAQSEPPRAAPVKPRDSGAANSATAHRGDEQNVAPTPDQTDTDAGAASAPSQRLVARQTANTPGSVSADSHAEDARVVSTPPATVTPTGSRVASTPT